MIITWSECEKLGISWVRFCEITGTNEWALSDGLFQEDGVFDITVEQFKNMVQQCQNIMP